MNTILGFSATTHTRVGPGEGAETESSDALEQGPGQVCIFCILCGMPTFAECHPLPSATFCRMPPFAEKSSWLAWAFQRRPQRQPSRRRGGQLAGGPQRVPECGLHRGTGCCAHGRGRARAADRGVEAALGFARPAPLIRSIVR